MKRTLITIWVSVLVLLCIFEIVPQVAAAISGKEAPDMLFLPSASATEYPDEGKCGENAYYSIKDGTLTISGTGAMYDYLYECDGDFGWDEVLTVTPWAYRRDISDIVVEEGITRIGDQAFATGRYNSIQIPSSVSEIGEEAFRWVTIDNIYLPSLEDWCRIKLEGYGPLPDYGKYNMYFNGEPAPKDLVIPESITEIGDRQFEGFRIESVKFHKNIKSVGQSAFWDCNLLTTVYAEDVGAWLNIDFETMYSNPLYKGGKLFIGDTEAENIIVPDGTTAIKPYVFEKCKNIKSVQIPAGVTEIGDGAFSGCDALESALLPDGLKRIGEKAFSGCSSLKEINIPGSVESIGNYAFYECVNADEIIINKGVTVIPAYCFANIKNVGLLVLPDTLTNINTKAFQSVNAGIIMYGGKETIFKALSPSLVNSRNIIFNATPENTVIEDGIVYNGDKTSLLIYSAYKHNSSYDMPDTVTSVAPRAFRENDYLRFIRFSDSLNTIGDNACRNMYSLKGIYLPSSLKTIGYAAFEKDDYLKEVYTKLTQSKFASVKNGGSNTGLTDAKYYYSTAVAYRDGGLMTSDGKVFVQYEALDEATEFTVPSGVERVAPGAFRGAASLKKVTLPDGVKELGDSVFYDCSALENINLPEGMTSVGKYAFYQCTALTEVYMPDTVTSAGSHLFCACKSLEKVHLSDSITEIGTNSFLNCTKLKEVNIPSSTKEIGGSAFANCTVLENIKLPDSITKIGSYAFEKCKNLGKLRLPVRIREIQSYAFSECSKLYITYYPASLLRIGDYAFYCCHSLPFADICSGTKIGKAAFMYCSGLEHVSFEYGSDYVGQSAFSNCTGIKRVYIPNTMVKDLKNTMGSRCFYNCFALKEVYFSGTMEQWFTFPNLSGENTLAAAHINFGHKHSFSEVFTPDEEMYGNVRINTCGVCGCINTKRTDASDYKVTLSYSKYTYKGTEIKPVVTIKDSKGNKLEKDKDYILTYGNNVNVGKANVQITYTGAYYGTKKVCFSIVPAKVENLKATPTQTTVTLFWKAVPQARTYRIYKYNSTTKQYTQKWTTQSCSYKVTGLSKGTNYTYYVKASKTVSGTKYLSNSYAKIKTATRPATPKTPTLTAGSKKITVKWAKVTGAEKYEVLMATSKNGDYRIKTTTTKSSFVKTGLTSGKTYYFKIRAFKEVDGKKSYSGYSPANYIKAK